MDVDLEPVAGVGVVLEDEQGCVVDEDLAGDLVGGQLEVAHLGHAQRLTLRPGKGGGGGQGEEGQDHGQGLKGV